MNQQEILKKIGNIIAELKEQYAYIEASDTAFNELELELFMANANFLTDHIEILKKIYNQPKVAELPPAKPVQALPEKVYQSRPEIPDYFSEEQHEIYAEDAPRKLKDIFIAEVAGITPEAGSFPENASPEIIILPEMMPVAAVDEVPVLADASFITEKSASPAEQLSVDEVMDAAPEVISIPEPGTIAVPVFIQPETNFVIPEKQPEPQIAEVREPENTQPLTLNQRIAAQKGLDIATGKPEQVHQPVTDLQSLISLNDKLLFVKELFNGYSLAYSEAITILNRYTNFEQAESFLKSNYVLKNDWKEKPATSERFYNLLRKRFDKAI